jgi:F0F1-type ATP synthase alpha subunit
MTTRMFIKFLNCTKALVIPEDKDSHSVIVLDTTNDIDTADRIRTIRAPIEIELISESFDSLVKKLEKPIKNKEIFILHL